MATDLSSSMPPANVAPSPNMVVGIGASAGGLAALRQFFSAVPADSGLAFVVVVHLSPDHESHLAAVLQPSVRIPVQQVTETVALEPNHVYVIPPGRNLSTIDTHLRLDKLEPNRAQRAPIDHFFRTLSKSHDGQSIAVILTGTGSDGTLGLKEIKERGGLVIVQDPNDAEYDGMPQSAVATGLADFVLPLSKIPRRVLAMANSTPHFNLPLNGEEPTDEQRVLLHKIFAQIRSHVGRDFTQYKRSTIMRRISRRMQLRQIRQLTEYLQRLEDEPNEVQALADDLLITVTNFFRDPEVYSLLESDVIPKLFEGKGPEAEVRVWSVGCATGEEAYSLAMLLTEVAARMQTPPKIQVFASDLHENSLARARDGFYPGDIATEVPLPRLHRFFSQERGGYRIVKEIRELVVFTHHNLLSDPPFSRLDLVSCRNVLIYLQRDIQTDIIELFHYALRPGGFLILGTSETVEDSDLFRTEFKKQRIYGKRNVPAPEPRLPVFPATAGRKRDRKTLVEGNNETVLNGTLHARVVEQYAPPSLLVTPDDEIVHISERAGRYLSHPGGEMTSSVLKLVREELRIELRAILHAAREQSIPMRTKPITVRFDGERGVVTIDVRPAVGAHQDGFVLVIFSEHPLVASADNADSPASTSAQLTDQEIDPAVHELQTELEMTRRRLQSVIEEYEAGQEEMRASNEELQSANEELRSTMEELETSKEELQSMNEELQTVNQENRHKVEELAQLAGDLQNLLAATHIATLFLNREMRILRFTPAIGDLFNVRPADCGRLLTDFTHRVGYGEMLMDCQKVLKSLVAIEREVQDDVGRWYLMRIMPYRSTDDRIEGVVLTFVDVTKRKRSEEHLRQSQERYRLLVENATEYAIVMLDTDTRIKLWNRGAERLFGYSEAEMIGEPAACLCTPSDRVADTLGMELERARQDGPLSSERWQQRKDGSQFLGGGVITSIQDDHDLHSGFAVVLRDNTERHRSEGMLRESEARLRLACEATGFGSYDYNYVRQQWVWSRELYHILGFPADAEIAHDNLSQRVHPEDLAEFERVHQEITRPGGTERHDHQFRIIVAGETRWLRDIGHSYFAGPDEEQRVVRIVGMVQDITEQKAYETSLHQARQAAEAANRSRGEFLANMSHEIRTPMTSILGHVDILSELLSNSEHRESLETIRRNGRFLLTILNDILDLSKIDAGKLQVESERVRLALLLSDLRSLIDVRASEKQLSFLIEFAGPVPETIDTDPIRLRQILLNLLGNAVKFTDQGSVRLVVRYTSDSSQLHFDVIDTGIGIHADAVNDLFQPFAQADASTTRNYGGTGLGLAICKRLAAMFGGDITVESRPGSGSRFSLNISCECNDGVAHVIPDLNEVQPIRIDPKNVKLSARILVADDRRDIRFLATRVLELAGATVETADTGRHAVEKVQQLIQSDELFDIVLMDMQMPEMDGYEATRVIRQLGYTRPIVALTANAMSGDRLKCLEAGCTDYLTKPIAANTMLLLIDRLLHGQAVSEAE